MTIVQGLYYNSPPNASANFGILQGLVSRGGRVTIPGQWDEAQQLWLPVPIQGQLGQWGSNRGTIVECDAIRVPELHFFNPPYNSCFTFAEPSPSGTQGLAHLRDMQLIYGPGQNGVLLIKHSGAMLHRMAMGNYSSEASGRADCGVRCRDSYGFSGDDLTFSGIAGPCIDLAYTGGGEDLGRHNGTGNIAFIKKMNAYGCGSGRPAANGIYEVPPDAAICIMADGFEIGPANIEHCWAGIRMRNCVGGRIMAYIDACPVQPGNLTQPIIFEGSMNSNILIQGFIAYSPDDAFPRFRVHHFDGVFMCEFPHMIVEIEQATCPHASTVIHPTCTFTKGAYVTYV